jgi:hypothetical protein
VELSRFDPESLARMRQALLSGEPIHLVAREIPEGLRIDEIAPLLSSVRTENPRLRAAFEARLAPKGRPGPGPEVTVVIPSHRRTPLGLAGWVAQDVRPRVLVVSNGAQGPVQAPGAELLRMDWLGHGETRQEAVERVRTPYVFFTVDDALPLGRGLLRTLVEELEKGAYEAVVARQIPWPDADHITAERLRRWTPSGERAVDFPQTDNVGTLYRTELLRRAPFPDVPIAEDAWWSLGRRIGYVPFAPVLHSHERSPRELFRRNKAIHEQLVRMGRPPTVKGLGAVLGALPGAVRPVAKGGMRELGNQVGELLGQWAGGRAGRR